MILYLALPLATLLSIVGSTAFACPQEPGGLSDLIRTLVRHLPNDPHHAPIRGDALDDLGTLNHLGPERAAQLRDLITRVRRLPPNFTRGRTLWERLMIHQATSPTWWGAGPRLPVSEIAADFSVPRLIEQLRTLNFRRQNTIRTEARVASLRPGNRAWSTEVFIQGLERRRAELISALADAQRADEITFENLYLISRESSFLASFGIDLNAEFERLGRPAGFWQHLSDQVPLLARYAPATRGPRGEPFSGGPDGRQTFESTLAGRRFLIPTLDPLSQVEISPLHNQAQVELRLGEVALTDDHYYLPARGWTHDERHWIMMEEVTRVSRFHFPLESHQDILSAAESARSALVRSLEGSTTNADLLHLAEKQASWNQHERGIPFTLSHLYFSLVGPGERGSWLSASERARLRNWMEQNLRDDIQSDIRAQVARIDRNNGQDPTGIADFPQSGDPQYLRDALAGRRPWPDGVRGNPVSEAIYAELYRLVLKRSQGSPRPPAD